MMDSDIDKWSQHLWHVSQHNHIVIGLSARLQRIAQEMRASVGLQLFGWNDIVDDSVFNECSVHVSDCAGQHTHPDVIAWRETHLANEIENNDD